MTSRSFLLPRQLEKFKFVLDFKIKELKRQIEPRETEIGSMKEQIKEMDRELEQVRPALNVLEDSLKALYLAGLCQSKLIILNSQEDSQSRPRCDFTSEVTSPPLPCSFTTATLN